ncbi:hypothetical protein GQX73_g2906 [Xylaria multiplex]|uniref:Mid2 domain-containing protein n=1 Tax=Xylaria multiplex TaxID=323545 RepID=A0A7C8IUL6_9PEZI|nr:hypothetical protein GQX73_g2906 [Xylaria multiplex]
MYSKRWVHLLFVALSILVATRASWFQHDVEARQLSSSSAADDSVDAATTSDQTTAASSTSAAVTSSESETSTEPTSTPSDEPTSTTDEPTTSDTPTPTVSTTSTGRSTTTSASDTGPITSAPSSEPTSSVSSTTSDGGDDSDSETSENTRSTRSTTVTPVTRTTTYIYTSTDSSGQTHVGTSESLVVSTPAFSGDGSNNNGNSGVTPSQRNIIIGVTVGVGGAIILAAGGILFWRLRNKRRSQEESEELISYGAGFGGPGTAEKTEASGPSAGARSPFQSTLETYHAPTQTNAASNF